MQFDSLKLRWSPFGQLNWWADNALIGSKATTNWLTELIKSEFVPLISSRKFSTRCLVEDCKLRSREECCPKINRNHDGPNTWPATRPSRYVSDCVSIHTAEHLWLACSLVGPLIKFAIKIR